MELKCERVRVGDLDRNDNGRKKEIREGLVVERERETRNNLLLLLSFIVVANAALSIKSIVPTGSAVTVCSTYVCSEHY